MTDMMNNFRQDIIHALIHKPDSSAQELAQLLEYNTLDVYDELSSMAVEGLVAPPPGWSAQGAEQDEQECFSGECPCRGCSRWRYCGGAISRALAASEEC